MADARDPRVTSTHGHDPDAAPSSAPGPVDPATGQHTSYWVLTEEERAEGFVRPVRSAYQHKICGTVTSFAASASAPTPPPSPPPPTPAFGGTSTSLPWRPRDEDRLDAIEELVDEVNDSPVSAAERAALALGLLFDGRDYAVLAGAVGQLLRGRRS